MAPKLNASQESFIGMMKKSDDHAARGFELLSKRDDGANYFDAVKDAGLFDPAHNPSAVAVPDKPGFVRIPYWRALDYLQALARQSGERGDLALATNVLEIVRAVTEARLPDGTSVDNHYTFWRFAEILGLVPLAALSDGTVALASNWLESKFDRSLAGHALSDGAMKRLLESDAPADLHRACMLLDYCTAIRWVPEDGSELATVVDDFWLRDMFAKHIKTFGAKAGAEVAALFAARLRLIFTDKRRSYQSSLWRPAIENHKQNYDFRGAENRFVEGLRDVLLEWSDTGDAAARIFVAELAADSVEILRRIALHIIDERFELFGALIDPVVDTNFFTPPFRHELYRLLSRHFAEFSDLGKDAVLTAIRAIPLPKHGEKRALHRKYVQRDWLSALRDKGYVAADTLFAELDAVQDLGPLSAHPDFLTFHETRSGPGPSPFTADLLIAAAKDGTLLEKLAGFHEQDRWQGPTEEGMWDMLQTAVVQAPSVFLQQLDAFVAAPIPVVHAVISGLRKSLDIAPNTKPIVARVTLWPSLLAYFEAVLGEPTFWAEEVPASENMVARRGWVLSAMADTLASGTRIDASAYAIRLLPQGWRILRVLLARAPGIVELRQDPESQAINTPRGRAIEALVNHALRVCRLRSKKKQPHAAAWAEMQDAFDEQLALCKNGNFDFSVLMAQYLANLDFLSPTWLENNFDAIFPKDYPDNFRCALAGLPYAQLTGRVYHLLADRGVLAAALDSKPHSDREGHRVIEFLCLAVLWGEEEITSPLFTKLFEAGRETQLVAASDYFWGARGDKITLKQKAIILDFWASAIAWAQNQNEAPKTLLSHLGRLAVYLNVLDAKTAPLLAAVVPSAGHDFNFQIVIEELSRLAPGNPAEASRILGLMLAGGKPNYDVDDRLKTLLRFLAAHGERAAVLEYANQLIQSLPGMLAFYEEVAAGV